MIEQLQNFDASLLVAINNSYTGWTDVAMWLVSSKWSWSLLVIAMLFTLRDKSWRESAWFLVLIALTVLIADQVSSSIIKHAVERLRPTHEPSLSGLVRVVNDYRGGLYGFVSSHAANTVGVTIVICSTMASRLLSVTMALWTALVCYSRIYLGVHYPGDIAGGLVVGILAAVVVLLAARIVARRYGSPTLPRFNVADSRVMTASVVATLLIIIVSATVKTI